LNQVGDLFELNLKLWRQKVKNTNNSKNGKRRIRNKGLPKIADYVIANFSHIIQSHLPAMK
jgi:hypothetical protein